MSFQNPHILALSLGFMFAGWGVGIYWTVKAALMVLRWKAPKDS